MICKKEKGDKETGKRFVKDLLEIDINIFFLVPVVHLSFFISVRDDQNRPACYPGYASRVFPMLIAMQYIYIILNRNRQLSFHYRQIQNK